ncbi:MAG: hypothetical protein RL477_1099 [Pseudomonadota bacterium]|jgi:DNA-binding NarL/FixJ family response regulator
MRPGAIKQTTGTVVIVGDDAQVREAVAAALTPQVTVAATLPPSPPDALERFAADVVVWDLGPSPQADLAAVRRVADAGFAVVALIAAEQQASAVLEAGAAGVHLRTAAHEHLPVALAAAAEGLIVLDDSLRARVAARRTSTETGPNEPLTPREREVLDLLALGRSNRDIALALGIAERTAKFHVNAILDKLDAKGRTEAVVRAARLGLVVL